MLLDFLAISGLVVEDEDLLAVLALPAAGHVASVLDAALLSTAPLVDHASVADVLADDGQVCLLVLADELEVGHAHPRVVVVHEAVLVVDQHDGVVVAGELLLFLDPLGAGEDAGDRVHEEVVVAVAAVGVPVAVLFAVGALDEAGLAAVAAGAEDVASLVLPGLDGDVVEDVADDVLLEDAAAGEASGLHLGVDRVPVATDGLAQVADDRREVVVEVLVAAAVAASLDADLAGTEVVHHVELVFKLVDLQVTLGSAHRMARGGIPTGPAPVALADGFGNIVTHDRM